MRRSYKRIRPKAPQPPPPDKSNTFMMPFEPRPISTPEISELLRLLGAYTYTPLQAEHVGVILKGQTR